MPDDIAKLNEDLEKVVREREPATDPWSRAVPVMPDHDNAAEHQARVDALKAQMEEHNERVAHNS